VRSGLIRLGQKVQNIFEFLARSSEVWPDSQCLFKVFDGFIELALMGKHHTEIIIIISTCKSSYGKKSAIRNWCKSRTFGCILGIAKIRSFS
jgi:hypothetical protein